MFRDPSISPVSSKGVADKVDQSKLESLVAHSLFCSETVVASGKGSVAEFDYEWNAKPKLELSDIRGQCVLEVRAEGKVSLLPVAWNGKIAPLAFSSKTNAVLTDVLAGLGRGVGIVCWSLGTYVAAPSTLHHSVGDVDILLAPDGRLAVIAKVQNVTCSIRISLNNETYLLVVVHFDTALAPLTQIALNPVADSTVSTASVPGYTVTRGFFGNADLTSDNDLISAPQDALSVSGVVELQKKVVHKTAKAVAEAVDEAAGAVTKVVDEAIAEATEAVAGAVDEAKAVTEAGDEAADAITFVKFFAFVISAIVALLRSTDLKCEIPAASTAFDLRQTSGLVLTEKVDFAIINGTQYALGEQSPEGITITTGGSLIVSNKSWIGAVIPVKVVSGASAVEFNLTLEPVKGAESRVFFEVPSGKNVHIPIHRVMGNQPAEGLDLGMGVSVVGDSFVIKKSSTNATVRMSVLENASAHADALAPVILGSIAIETNTNMHLAAATTQEIFVKRGTNKIPASRKIAYAWFDEKDTEAYLTESVILFKNRCLVSINDFDITVQVDDMNASVLPSFSYAIYNRAETAVKNWHTVKLKMQPEAAHDDIIVPCGQHAVLCLQDNDYNPSQCKRKVTYAVGDAAATPTFSLETDKIAIKGDSSGKVEIDAKTDFIGSALDVPVKVCMGDDETAELTVSFVPHRGPAQHVHYESIDGTDVCRGSLWSDAKIASFAIDTVSFESRTYSVGTVFYCAYGALMVSADGSFVFSPNLFPKTAFAGLGDIVCYGAYGANNLPVVLSIQSTDNAILAGPYVVRGGMSGKYAFSLCLPDGVEVKSYGTEPGKPISAGSKLIMRSGSFKCARSGIGRVENSSGNFGFVYVLLTGKNGTRLTTCEINFCSDIDALDQMYTHTGNVKLSGDTLLKYGLRNSVFAGTMHEVGKIANIDNDLLFRAEADGRYRMWVSSAFKADVTLTYLHGSRGTDDAAAVQSEQILATASASGSGFGCGPLGSRRSRSLVSAIKRDSSPVQRALAVTFEQGGSLVNARRRSLSRGRVVTYPMYPEGTMLPAEVVAQYGELLTAVKPRENSNAVFYTCKTVIETPTCVFRPVSPAPKPTLRILGAAGYSYSISELSFCAWLHSGSGVEVLSDEMRIVVSVKTSVGADTTIILGIVLQERPGECEHFETRKIILFPGSVLPAEFAIGAKGVRLESPLEFASGEINRHPIGPMQLTYENFPHAWAGICTFVEDASIEDRVILAVGNLSQPAISRKISLANRFPSAVDDAAEKTQKEHVEFLDFVAKNDRKVDVAPRVRAVEKQEAEKTPADAAKAVKPDTKAEKAPEPDAEKAESKISTAGFVMTRQVDIAARSSEPKKREVLIDRRPDKGVAPDPDSILKTTATLTRAPVDIAPRGPIARTAPAAVAPQLPKSVQHMQRNVAPMVIDAPSVTRRPDAPRPVAVDPMPIPQPRSVNPARFATVPERPTVPVKVSAPAVVPAKAAASVPVVVPVKAAAPAPAAAPAATHAPSVALAQIGVMTPSERKVAMGCRTRDVTETYPYVPIPFSAVGNPAAVNCMSAGVCLGIPEAFFFSVAGVHTVQFVSADGVKSLVKFDVKALPMLPKTAPEVKLMPPGGLVVNCTSASAICYGSNEPLVGTVRLGKVTFALKGPALARFTLGNVSTFVIVYV